MKERRTEDLDRWWWRDSPAGDVMEADRPGMLFRSAMVDMVAGARDSGCGGVNASRKRIPIDTDADADANANANALGANTVAVEKYQLPLSAAMPHYAIAVVSRGYLSLCEAENPMADPRGPKSSR